MNPVKPLDWLRAAMDDDRLTTTERAAVAGVARRAPGKEQRQRFAGQETGWDFYLSRNELAGFMAASIPTAERCLARLHDLGLLDMVARGGRRGTKTVATVWRLAIPNTSQVRTWDASQPITSDDLGTGPNPSETEFPTHQGHRSQPITGDDPREHSYQKSAVDQGSTADAQSLTRLLVLENDTTTAQGTRPTQVGNSGTDRTRIPTTMPAANTSEAWV